MDFNIINLIDHIPSGLNQPPFPNVLSDFTVVFPLGWGSGWQGSLWRKFCTPCAEFVLRQANVQCCGYCCGHWKKN